MSQLPVWNSCTTVYDAQCQQVASLDLITNPTPRLAHHLGIVLDAQVGERLKQIQEPVALTLQFRRSGHCVCGHLERGQAFGQVGRC